MVRGVHFVAENAITQSKTLLLYVQHVTIRSNSRNEATHIKDYRESGHLNLRNALPAALQNANTTVAASVAYASSEAEPNIKPIGIKQLSKQPP
jgi:hypothetical protein